MKIFLKTLGIIIGTIGIFIGSIILTSVMLSLLLWLCKFGIWSRLTLGLFGLIVGGILMVTLAENEE